ncbi:aspartyl-tRNA synthetase [Melghirimyces profundicolus]|uniref:Aspartate--tRNA ligase n=1 Tax=Melghirimyces profundicolus TaxID=1242148 RepID=A0A2T6BQQ4_9BACL|nr:aspartate--tRNA ligase [Melghirimyces profundicolus]PTX58421.1 aspartyl-tRNA synthetase [Melghirimyces profundicolus]
MESNHRSHFCGELTQAQVGEKVVLNGWVQRRRDLGGLIFLDLRDRSGTVQVVCNPEVSPAAAESADQVRGQYVLAVEGEVVARAPETVNPKMKTGEIEVQAFHVEILNPSKTPPFMLTDDTDVEENTRLKYRYLDLRRPVMQNTLKLRHRAMQSVRRFLDERGFIEVETPMLTKSTPEGARDYLVPSRVHEGEFYALPQSPQIFKQLLMVAGMERYFQIVRCFRDEDLRADRQPEFTQIDIETSFLDTEALLTMMEEMVATLFRETIGVEVERPFPRIPYREAMERFGSDKPDLRFGMELVDLSEILRESSFRVFTSALEAGGRVKAINVKGQAGWSRKVIDGWNETARELGAKGLAWLAVREEGTAGPVAKFLSEQEWHDIMKATEAETGDLLFFIADQPRVAAEVLGELRVRLAKELGRIPEGVYRFAWVTEFPLLSYDEEEGRYYAEHHPFTSPVEEDIPLLKTDPSRVRAQAYDMVLNGYEIGGGSRRIHRREVQEAMFEALGFSMEEAREQFGFMLEAFEYGAPPHGGVAFGFDRIVMLLAGRNNLRDTIAFPKTASAACLMTGAPSPVSDRQLEELHISRRKGNSS